MRFLILIFFVTTFTFSQEYYQKTYFDNGNLKSEGWVENNQKIKYWKFYYENGSLKKEGHYNNDKPAKYWYYYYSNSIKKEEGHYIDGEKNNWWVFYNSNGTLLKKCQYKNNLKNGYCLNYKRTEMISATKFTNGKKLKEWTDMATFKKENNLKDLK